MPSHAYLDLLRHDVTERIPSLLAEMEDLHIRKSAGYAGQTNPDAFENIRACQRDFGVAVLDGLVTRLSDKWSRFGHVYRDPTNDQVHEPIREIVIDMAAYLLIFTCILDEHAETHGEL